LRFRFVTLADKPTEFLQESADVFLVRSDKNGGYSYGNNLGISFAKSLALFSYLLIINNDIVLKENFLEEMVNCYEGLRIRFKTEKIALGGTELGEDGRFHHKGFHYIHLLTGITFYSPLFLPSNILSVPAFLPILALH
jgi:GT2 family glycosyltransferase